MNESLTAVENYRQLISFSDVCDLLGKTTLETMGIMTNYPDFPHEAVKSAMTYYRDEIENWIASHSQPGECAQVQKPDIEIVADLEQKDTQAQPETKKLSTVEINQETRTILKQRIKGMMKQKFWTATECGFFMGVQNKTLFKIMADDPDFPQPVGGDKGSGKRFLISRKELFLWIKKTGYRMREVSHQVSKHPQSQRDNGEVIQNLSPEERIRTLNERDLWDAVDVALVTGISTSCIATFQKEKGFPAAAQGIRGPKKFYLREEVQKWLKKNEAGV